MAKANSYKRINSVKKTFEILDFLSASGPANPGEISKAVDVPVDSVMCHLATLRDIRAIEIDENGYQIGQTIATYWARYCHRLRAQKSKLDVQIACLDPDSETADVSAIGF